jgi:hypothetical protein
VARQSREFSAAAKLNDEHLDDLSRKYPWLSDAEIREMLAEAAEEYGAEETVGVRLTRPTT